MVVRRLKIIKRREFLFFRPNCRQPPHVQVLTYPFIIRSAQGSRHRPFECRASRSIPISILTNGAAGYTLLVKKTVDAEIKAGNAPKESPTW